MLTSIYPMVDEGPGRQNDFPIGPRQTPVTLVLPLFISVNLDLTHLTPLQSKLHVLLPGDPRMTFRRCPTSPPRAFSLLRHPLLPSGDSESPTAKSQD